MVENTAAGDAWLAAYELLRSNGTLSDSQTAFVRMAHPLAAVDDIFMIAVGSEFVKSWIQDNVSVPMADCLSDILGREVRIIISVDASLSEQPASIPAPTPMPQWTHEDHTLSVVEDPRDSAESRASSVRQHPSSEAEGVTPIAPVPDAVDSRSHIQSVSPSTPTTAPSRVERVNEPTSPSAASAPNLVVRKDGITAAQREANLNPRYTFDNFVIGESNRFAHACALAVAETPGSTYNPLFLYSDSGMGKTHLIHAIGNDALKMFPHIKVRYVSAEEFTNLFINSLRDGTAAKFKDQFRNVDILLIDDIQFISDKESTVEEFFHTFNALSNANKQIVITSDVAPRLLNGFEDRMISRFASGVTASIDRPNLETRIAILEKKAHAESMVVPRNVLEHIASLMTTNVREMEGALRRVTAFAGLSNSPVTQQIAEMALKDMVADPTSITITAGLILAQTSAYFGVSMNQIISPDRSRHLVTARQIGMYLCREMTTLSLPKIGEIFGGRDHTTVIHAYRKINKQMAEKQAIYNQVSELTSRVQQAAKEQAAAE